MMLVLLMGAITWDQAPILDGDVRVAVQQTGRAVPNVTLRAQHHPGAPDERLVSIGPTNQHGKVVWNPEYVGLALIHAGDQRQVVAIGPLGWGGMMMALGCAALLCGVAVGARRMRW